MATILVIDDEEHIRKMYEMDLADEGHRVLCPSDCREALLLLENEKIDLVILDIRMPDMDGRIVLAKIREMDIRFPVIISSAYPMHKQEFGVWAADDFFVKEHDLSDLKAKIRRLLSLSESQDHRETSHGLLDTADPLSDEGNGPQHDTSVTDPIQVLDALDRDAQHLESSLRGHRFAVVDVLRFARDVDTACGAMKGFVLRDEQGGTISFLPPLLHDIKNASLRIAITLRKAINEISRTDIKAARYGLLELRDSIHAARMLVDARPNLDQSVKMPDVVLPVLSRVIDDLNEGDVSLQCDVTNHVMRGDPFLLRETVKILVENAVQAEARLIRVVGDVLYRRGALESSITVIDNGQGIDDDAQNLIFDLGYTTRKDPGVHGLGLFIAQRTAAVHGGTLEVQSSLGKGSRFVLAIPIPGKRRRWLSARRSLGLIKRTTATFTSKRE